MDEITKLFIWGVNLSLPYVSVMHVCILFSLLKNPIELLIMISGCLKRKRKSICQLQSLKDKIPV